MAVAKLETVLGDALFAADVDFQKFGPARPWQDTPHFHVDSEVHIILRGEALLEIDGEDVRMQAGDICLLAPGSSHYPKSGSDTLEKTNFSFGLSQNYGHSRSGKSFSEYLHYSSVFRSVSEYFLINDAELLYVVEKLISEGLSPEREHICRVLLAEFFIMLARRIEEHHLPYREQAVRRVSESENSVSQRKCVEAFFQLKYNEEIGIGDLAAELCLSVPQTHRIVKKVFDEGFKKTLIKQRIEHACMLIKQNGLPLSEIAYRCGYTSYNGFLAAFKSYMGQTPKEYARSLR